jgi:hypothetical protein
VCHTDGHEDGIAPLCRNAVHAGVCARGTTSAPEAAEDIFWRYFFAPVGRVFSPAFPLKAFGTFHASATTRVDTRSVTGVPRRSSPHARTSVLHCAPCCLTSAQGRRRGGARRKAAPRQISGTMPGKSWLPSSDRLRSRELGARDCRPRAFAAAVSRLRCDAATLSGDKTFVHRCASRHTHASTCRGEAAKQESHFVKSRWRVNRRERAQALMAVAMAMCGAGGRAGSTA